MSCAYEGRGKACPEENIPNNIFCERHKDEARYIGLVCKDEQEAEDLARQFRNNNHQAHEYQHYFVIVGPTNAPAHYFQNGGPCFEAFRYESILEAFINMFGLIVINEPAHFILHPKTLNCPKCGTRHIDHLEEDGTDWARKPHHKHLCHSCGNVWQPFKYNTIGV